MKIMFICTGNICRSAMAKALFQKMVEENNKNKEVYSSGISAYTGDEPTYNAIEAMKEYGIDLSNHRATYIEDSDIKDMDLILCATLSHKRAVLQLYPSLEGKVFTMKQYVKLDREGQDMDIKDPWGYNLETYKASAKEIYNCLQELIKKV